MKYQLCHSNWLNCMSFPYRVGNPLWHIVNIQTYNYIYIWYICLYSDICVHVYTYKWILKYSIILFLHIYAHISIFVCTHIFIYMNIQIFSIILFVFPISILVYVIVIYNFSGQLGDGIPVLLWPLLSPFFSFRSHFFYSSFFLFFISSFFFSPLLSLSSPLFLLLYCFLFSPYSKLSWSLFIS